MTPEQLKRHNKAIVAEYRKRDKYCSFLYDPNGFFAEAGGVSPNLQSLKLP
jgi:hypothetical protein